MSLKQLERMLDALQAQLPTEHVVPSVVPASDLRVIAKRNVSSGFASLTPEALAADAIVPSSAFTLPLDDRKQVSPPIVSKPSRSPGANAIWWKGRERPSEDETVERLNNLYHGRG